MTDQRSSRAVRDALTHSPNPGYPARPRSAAAMPPDDADRRPPRDAGARRKAVTCSIAWRTDGFEAIELFVGPALRDRADELCAAIDGWAGVHRHLDDLSDEIRRYADREGLSVGIYPWPGDDLSSGLLAIEITVG